MKADREAFGSLYERYLDQIYRYVFYRVLSSEEAEDLTESTFLHVWQDLRNRKNQIKNFSAWVYRVAHNLVIDHQRKKKPVSIDLEDSAEFTPGGDPGTEDAVLIKLDSQQVVKALQQLEHNAQQVIILRFLNGLSHTQTAQALSLNEGHVRVLQYRALKQLREILNEDKDE